MVDLIEEEFNMVDDQMRYQLKDNKLYIEIDIPADLKAVVSGDLKPTKNLIDLGKDSDILIHEATFAEDLAELTEEKKHSTSTDAANEAIDMNAK